MLALRATEAESLRPISMGKGRGRWHKEGFAGRLADNGERKETKSTEPFQSWLPPQMIMFMMAAEKSELTT